MKWWYENEEEEMKLYKNEDLCIECKNEFFSKPYDHRDPTPGQLGYCIKCDNCLIKDKKMEFLRERVYTALNADELRAGDKVIVSYNLYGLKEQVKMFTESAIDVIEVIQDEDYFNRFKVKHGESFPLAYLVERAENCTNCGKTDCSAHSEHDDFKVAVCSNWIPKAEPKTEQKAEKHYRPFKDTDELIKVWGSRCSEGKGYILNSLDMPLIWVQSKDKFKSRELITGFDTLAVSIGIEGNSMGDLFREYTFLDGSPCGVEE